MVGAYSFKAFLYRMAGFTESVLLKKYAHGKKVCGCASMPDIHTCRLHIRGSDVHVHACVHLQMYIFL